MSNGYPAEIVTADTEDGFILDGMVLRPTTGAAQPLPIVWVHGHTGSFCSPTSSRVGRAMAARGYTFISGNNRGNGVANFLRRCNPPSPDDASILAGASFEKFSGSEYDVAAWMDFASSLGYQQVILMGHSYGGVKVTYYQANRADSRVAGLITASPWAHIWRDLYQPERVELARKMIAAGQGQSMLPSVPDHLDVSAECYADLWTVNPDVFGLYTSDSRVARITCPILAFYGTLEPSIGDEPTLAHIKTQAKAAASIQTMIFEGSDHVYTDSEAQVADAVAEWIRRLR